MQSRGRIGFNRDRGSFNAMQITSTPIIPVNQSVTPQQIAVQQTTWNKRPIGYEQCARCKGWGHWASECPSYRQGSRGGRGRFTCGRTGGNRRGRFGGRRGGRNSGNGGNQAVNAALTMSESGAPGSQLQQVQDATPDAYVSAGKLAGPLRGQPSLLGARSDDLGRQDPRVKIGGLCEGNPTTKMQNYKYRSKEEVLAARKTRRNRARKMRRRRAIQHLMAASEEEKAPPKMQKRGGVKKWKMYTRRRYSHNLRRGKQRKKRRQELNRQIWQQLRASVLRAEEIATSITQLARKEERVDKEHVEDNLLNEAMVGRHWVAVAYSDQEELASVDRKIKDGI